MGNGLDEKLKSVYDVLNLYTILKSLSKFVIIIYYEQNKN